VDIGAFGRCENLLARTSAQACLSSSKWINIPASIPAERRVDLKCN
jgi:hypothetical protein